MTGLEDSLKSVHSLATVQRADEVAMARTERQLKLASRAQKLKLNQT